MKDILKKVFENWKYPSWWTEIVLSGWYHLKGNDGDNVLDYEWDNLIILDACSCRAFQREFSIRHPDRKVKCRVSNATCTLEFLIRTFIDEYYPDIVYITGNPYPNKIFKNKFYKIVPVWLTGWDDRTHTVPPENMLRATLLALKKYPNKKFIIHFMQPHFPYLNLPFLDDGSMKLFRESTIKGSQKLGAQSLSKFHLKSPFRVVSSPIYLLGTREDHLRGYFYNLRRAMDIVEELLKLLPGKTLVTADHGDAFGEPASSLLPLRVYGHPWNIRIDVLKRVPLLLHENEYPRGEYNKKLWKKLSSRYSLVVHDKRNKKRTIKNVIARLVASRKV